ncbi:CDGSH iron-sulfur domain-containing protein [Streptomyces sp. NPDC096191]|uniref:CDGSH iron-sulfur domain-containing protein n=1 Tax=Streptomyces sp. NPDC096191 TaxID=3155426 RepID=UPI003319023D
MRSSTSRPRARGEAPERPTTITGGATGQVLVRGELSVETPQGVRAETRVVLCGCGRSRLRPYCDHTGPCGQ